MKNISDMEEPNDKKPSYWVAGLHIPKEMLNLVIDKKLAHSDILLLAYIHSLDKGDRCYASNKYLAGLLGVSEQNISRSISKLVKAGFVKQDGFTGRIRFLKSLVDTETGYD